MYPLIKKLKEFKYSYIDEVHEDLERAGNLINNLTRSRKFWINKYCELKDEIKEAKSLTARAYEEIIPLLRKEIDELSEKLQKIIQDDFINEDVYSWTQYCQTMDYNYSNEIDQLKEELKRKNTFLSSFELQISKGFPTVKEWNYLIEKHLEQRKVICE